MKLNLFGSKILISINSVLVLIVSWLKTVTIGLHWQARSFSEKQDVFEKIIKLHGDLWRISFFLATMTVFLAVVNYKCSEVSKASKVVLLMITLAVFIYSLAPE